MAFNADHVLTTHVGMLPHPRLSRDPGRSGIGAAAAGLIRAQREAGIDLVNEGEVAKGGIWINYVNDRLTGFEARESGALTALIMSGRDMIDYADYYADNARFSTAGRDWACIGPISYVGQDALRAEIAALVDNLGDVPLEHAFLTSTAPLSLEPGRANEYYATQEEFVFALAEALRVEYEMIAAAGIHVQVDDAWMAALWDRIGIEMGLEAYLRFCEIRVEALNHALRNIPPELVRYHLCWGSWHGPHATDIAMRDIIGMLLKVNAGTYLFEAANPRHEHECEVWRDVKLPEDKILAPGVVTHCTALVEHPDLVALRIRRFTDIVGRDRVIASTDCGLGLRVHPQIAWAKLRALSEGAAVASKALWI